MLITLAQRLQSARLLVCLAYSYVFFNGLSRVAKTSVN